MANELRDLRVKGIQDAASRSRIAFFICVVASGTIIIATYNNYFPWNRNYEKYQRTRENAILRDPCLPSDFQSPDPPDRVRQNPEKLKEWNSRLEEERKEVCKEFVLPLNLEKYKVHIGLLAAHNAIDLPWLGLRLGSSDLDILGSGGLFLACMYFLLCVRRFNNDVRSLLDDPFLIEPEERKYAFMAVQQSLVMNTETEESRDERGQPDLVVLSLQYAFRGLMYVPAIAIACLLASDVWYLIDKAFKDHTTVSGVVQSFQAEYWRQTWVGAVIATLMGATIFMLNRRVVRFDNEVVARVQRFAEDSRRMLASAAQVAAAKPQPPLDLN